MDRGLMFMRGWMADAVTASVSTIGVTMAGWLSVGVAPVYPVLAQMVTGTPQSAESMLEFAIRQGGAIAVLMLVLFYYRRDYRELVSYKTERDRLLFELVKESTKANVEMAAAIRENNVIVHQAKNLLAQQSGRREGDR
jgi:hypothetical protein